MTDVTVLVERLKRSADKQPNRIEAAACIETEAAEAITTLEKQLAEARGSEMNAATGTLSEAIKDLRRAGFREASELLESKTMPETIEIFKQNAAALKGSENDQAKR